ncbi:MAG TPA: MotA/TolQ/ExbB proton channel family protein [Candidatus Binataceae bacterium]|nr:MotA/TolQ/ExbB proton channel family protein [Candidatus Binataceae bacterium]
MQELARAWDAVKYGGAMVYPLLGLGALALIIIVDRAVVYGRMLRLPQTLLDLVESYDFSWSELEGGLRQLPPTNAYRRLLGVIASNRTRPAWWVESRAGDEAGDIEKTLNRGLWLLETVVTGAPLLGLLGTITGMMQAFYVIGASSLVAPTQVTAGVAQALIATALGLLIAIFALFGFNFFARTQSHAADRMERLGSRLVDHIRLDQENMAESPARITAAGGGLR